LQNLSARSFTTFFASCFVMADSNFDNGFEKVPAAGEFVAGAGVEGLRGPAVSSEESSQTSKSSCKFNLVVWHISLTGVEVKKWA